MPERIGGGAAEINVKHVGLPKPVAQTLARAKVDQRGRAGTGAQSSGLRLDVAVSAPNQIFVRGRGLDAELGGSVRLTGSVADMQPVGAFELVRGRLSILGQRLDFNSGTVTEFDSTYRDIVPNQRIVYVYDMTLDGKKISVERV